MKPSELLSSTKTRLLSGPAWRTWRRGTRVDLGDTYRPCVMECLGNVAGIGGGVARQAHRDAMEALNDAARGMRRTPKMLFEGDEFPAIDVNDTGPTRLWGVVAMLGRAIRRLEAEGR